MLLGLLGDGALCPDGRDVAQESQIHLAKQGGEGKISKQRKE